LPIVLGPVTLVKLCRYAVADQETSKAKLAAAFLKDHVLPQYVKLFALLKEAGHVDEVLLQEPILVVDHDPETRALLAHVLDALAQVGGPKVHLVTFFDDVGEETFQWLAKDAPKNVVGVSLDFTRGDNLGFLAKHGFPQHLTLGAGVVDARNVWQINVIFMLFSFFYLDFFLIFLQVDDVIAKLATIRSAFEGAIVVQPSASLQHVPYDAAVETKLPSALRQVLSFAFQKLKEVDFIARLIKKGILKKNSLPLFPN
jgi:5-methyltetrahydropteroyltriglutamate--homocysteine methyltransferase